MTRNTDRLEILARDLASRYGDDDRVVCEFRLAAAAKTATAAAGQQVWRESKIHGFKHARLAKLGIANPA